jgi:hypothetical protein
MYLPISEPGQISEELKMIYRTLLNNDTYLKERSKVHQPDGSYVTQHIIVVAGDSSYCSQELRIEIFDGTGILNTALETHYQPLTNDEYLRLDGVFG